jgi:hypothetical protein
VKDHLVEANFVQGALLKGEWRDEIVYSLREERIAATTDHA